MSIWKHSSSKKTHFIIGRDTAIITCVFVVQELYAVIVFSKNRKIKSRLLRVSLDAYLIVNHMGMITVWIKLGFEKYWQIHGEDERAD